VASHFAFVQPSVEAGALAAWLDVDETDGVLNEPCLPGMGSQANTQNTEHTARLTQNAPRLTVGA